MPVASLRQLKDLAETWHGSFPEPMKWQAAEHAARAVAEQEAISLEKRATRIEVEGLENQVRAARLRLLREVGRYLLSSGADVSDLNAGWYEQMSNETSGAVRLKSALERFGGYPEWPDALQRELEEFARNASANQRRGLLMGSQLDAALEDPRWEANAGKEISDSGQNPSTV